MSEFSAIGQRKPILDGHAKITGTAQYAPDLQLPGMLHARFVPSSYAHANIRNINIDEALAVPGVEAVLTHKDLPNIVPSSRNKLMLARGRVIFVGQPVAIVLASTETAAADGAERVWVDYEPLPAALNVDAALADDAPLVWPTGIPTGSEDAGAHGAAVGEGAEEAEREHTNVVKHESYTRGDIDKGFAEADIIVEHTYTSPMVHQGSLETHGLIAQPDLLSGGMHIWSSTQSPFDVRRDVAKVIGVDEFEVTVKVAVIGGAFGAKFSLYDALVGLVAHTIKRPVKLILTRSEELLATNPSPPMRIHARMGAKNDGTLVALQAQVYLEAGCYPANLGGFVGYQLGAPYPVPHMDIQTTEVLTFKQSCAAYRAPGAPTVYFVLDTLIDEISEKLGLDSIDVRVKNAAKQGDPLANGKPWPKQGMRETLEALKDNPLWRNRDQIKAKGHGVGIAIGGWMGGTSPAAAVCGLNRDGMITINVGSADIAGSFTSMAMLAAEAFGVSSDKVKLVQGDSNTSPFSTGTGGSKFVYTTGTAVVKAAQEARKQVLAIAAEEFEAAVEDLEIVDGEVRVKGLPSKSISLGTIAEKATGFGGKYPPVYASGSTVVTDQSPGFNAQLIEVALDQETGEVQVMKVVTAQDVGRAINPMAVEGQIMGGATQGIGWALYEAMLYNEDGQLITGSFMDYALPDAMQAGPEFETILVEVPSEHGPFGAKGVGEPPIIPTAAAVANAIAHASGVRMTEIPMTAPVVLAALKNGNGHN